MARRTKIPIVILLGILFLFVAISLYRGCAVVEGIELVNKYIKALTDLKTCQAQPKSKSKSKSKSKDDGGDSVVLRGPLCPDASSWQTDCNEILTKMNKSIFEGFEVTHGLKTAADRTAHGEQLGATANYYNGRVSIFPNKLFSWLGKIFARGSKYNLTEGKNLSIDGKSDIRDLKNVWKNMKVKNAKITREMAERSRATDLAKILSDGLSISTKGAVEAAKITDAQQRDINDLVKNAEEGNLDYIK